MFIKEPLLKESPKNILIPRFDTMGDIVLLEGFIESLLNKYPEAEVVLVVQEAYEQLKSIFPARIKWMTTKVKPYRRPNMDELNHLLDRLADRHWDIILTTTFNRTHIDESISLKLNNVRNIAIGKEREIPLRVRNIWQKMGLSGIPQYEFVPVEEFSHESEKYKEFWKSLTGQRDILIPSLIIRDNEIERAKILLSNIGFREKEFCICAPAGVLNVPIKAWAEERFAEVIVWMEREYNLRTLLTGHEKERKKVERVQGLSKSRGANSVVWLGKDGEVPLLTALIMEAKLYIGNDTGAMHIAAALGVPTVGIFGGGHWPRFIPIGSHSIGVVNILPCFGCEWDCIFVDAPCLRLITVDDAKKAIRIINESEGIDSNILKSSNKISHEMAQYIKRVLPAFELVKSRGTLYERVLSALKSIKSWGDLLCILSWKARAPLRWIYMRWICKRLAFSRQSE